MMGFTLDLEPPIVDLPRGHNRYNLSTVATSYFSHQLTFVISEETNLFTRVGKKTHPVLTIL